MKKPSDPVSIEMMLDDLLTEFGLELEVTTKDDSGTKTELVPVRPWSDTEPPADPEPS